MLTYVDHVGRVHERLETNLSSSSVWPARFVNGSFPTAHDVGGRIDSVAEAVHNLAVEFGLPRSQNIQANDFCNGTGHLLIIRIGLHFLSPVLVKAGSPLTNTNILPKPPWSSSSYCARHCDGEGKKKDEVLPQNNTHFWKAKWKEKNDILYYIEPSILSNGSLK